MSVRGWLCVAGLLLAAMGARAQNAAKPARFEVASVRMVPPDEASYKGITGSVSPPGESPFVARNCSLQILIMLAYDVNPNVIVNLPDELDNVGYDITARAERGRGLSYQELQAPLQALLAERFHLKVHRETRQMEGYALVLAKGGPKFGENFSPTKGGEAQPVMAGRELKMTNMPMSVFAILLGKPVERPVVDRTGLTARYDLDVKFSKLYEQNAALPDIFTVVQQLGLKLEHGKVPAEVLVIDHVEQRPTEN
jgi:uncharacterized protein (TIGR03435 family)